MVPRSHHRRGLPPTTPQRPGALPRCCGDRELGTDTSLKGKAEAAAGDVVKALQGANVAPGSPIPALHKAGTLDP